MVLALATSECVDDCVDFSVSLSRTKAKLRRNQALPVTHHNPNMCNFRRQSLPGCHEQLNKSALSLSASVYMLNTFTILYLSSNKTANIFIYECYRLCSASSDKLQSGS
jgi:hypothetical protein